MAYNNWMDCYFKNDLVSNVFECVELIVFVNLT